MPAISLKAACFGNNVFTGSSAADCISNLLATGFRRFVIDVYWSVTRRQWIFCPVSVPQGGANTATSSRAANDTFRESSSGSSVYQLGDYSCADDLDLSLFFNILGDYFWDNNADVDIHIIYVVFNVHAAADSSTPDQPPPTVTGGLSPSRTQFLGTLASDALIHYIYRPPHLAKERDNIDRTWFKVPPRYRPVTDYFTIHKAHDGTHYSPDGWPCSKFVQYADQRRLLFEYGSVDSEMQDYNPTRDSEVIFPPGYLSSTRETQFTGSRIKSGCLYRPGASAVSDVNSSWTQSNPVLVPSNANTTHALAQLSHSVQQLTTCGLSPVLNYTLFNATADSALDWYRNISQSSRWSWAFGEPKGANLSASNPGFKSYRCALMDTSLSGHWSASNCSEERYAACRVKSQPFNWAISNKPASFSDASDTCPDDTSFGTPRTGLENTYLYHTLLAQPKDIIDPASDNAQKREVWLDINSVDVQSCWVKGGEGTSCPYNTDTQQLKRKTVVVPAVASIVICTIAALTLFVKCNANRRNSRRRKRVIEGWDYEGVPS